MTQEQIEKYRMTLFVDYDLAVELKNKGFDMPCFANFILNEDDAVKSILAYGENEEVLDTGEYFLPCPSIDQVIEWLIEHHNLEISVKSWPKGKSIVWMYSVQKLDKPSTYKEECSTRKEAQLSGIKHALTLIP